MTVGYLCGIFFYMIILTDTFNKKVLSKHRSVFTAVKAQIKHAKAVKRCNGNNSYVWYSITNESGEDIREEVEKVEMDYETAKHYNFEQYNGRKFAFKWW